MNFFMIGLLPREALDRLRVRLNMYLVLEHNFVSIGILESLSREIDFSLMSGPDEKVRQYRIADRVAYTIILQPIANNLQCETTSKALLKSI